ncbi:MULTISPECIES: monovalent cation/H+ antiporter subunit D [Acinetobacter]|jgi:multicomponent K+:H+ antiporter subunit D|uniref:Monovalent cation/H+ antiporter subunit D n=1 Tax=Acinetobacter pittii TaxID=48296 RepID=A0AAE9M7Y5_ACIPI|nr:MULTISPECIES: monovalent cation/H+ antiporter subunit D [Acinetobacter calcoaceticus/baumannii complex]AZP30948.1 monovalent cation/H+ antiporter subunit D [Acinetobacter pittii]EXC28885.1 NADH-Ubiquinone/plastoquinone (complex I), various chains family protein [Acinetobacter sp. 809848]EXS18166.1 NADH-Ubiquinone/plastoquinone (complex I), various chains family protein [Acinetobacter sp. 883425]MBK0409060.1 monovalent cation/H+ antiporter subunit D [Acinetobacter pittii]MBK1415311.1 monoval
MFDFLSFWQQHTPIFSILIPAFTAFILLLLGNPGAGALKDDWRQPWRRGISLISAIAGLITAIVYLSYASTGQITVYQLSEWSAPFGIVLVLDRLSAFMLALTYALAVPVLWYASDNWDTRGRYFHAMVHFLLMGICGAFLTGDLFNLFVFFEILLMASYVLLLHGQGKPRFQLGVHYVIINLLASALFLIGLGMIYGSVGSLNMADVSRLIPTLEADQHKLAVAGSLLLLVVFGIKAAMLPVGFWLPKTYAVASTPVAAIFTIMTKVGIYSILRVNGTVFDDALSQEILKSWLLPIGLITSLYGVIAAIGADRLRRFVGFMVLSSIGTLLTAIAMSNTQAWSGALYYLVHSTLIGAAFYLFCGWITSQRGDFKDHLKVAPRIKQEKAAMLTYFLIAMMMAGLPPFSGFLGKVFILQATVEASYQGWIIGVVLVVSLLSIIALTRVGFILFWRASAPEQDPIHPAYILYRALPEHAPPRNDQVIYLLLAGLIAYVVFAAPIQHYTLSTAQQIQDHALYQHSILKVDQNGEVISVQPYDPAYLPETKYGGEVEDHNAYLVPDIISKDTFNGEHISEYKQRQIQQQDKLQTPTIVDESQLKPMEP